MKLKKEPPWTIIILQGPIGENCMGDDSLNKNFWNG